MFHPLDCYALEKFVDFYCIPDILLIYGGVYYGITESSNEFG